MVDRSDSVDVLALDRREVEGLFDQAKQAADPSLYREPTTRTQL